MSFVITWPNLCNSVCHHFLHNIWTDPYCFWHAIIWPLDPSIPVEPPTCGIPVIVQTFQSYQRKPYVGQCKNVSQFAPHQLLSRLEYDCPDILFPKVKISHVVSYQEDLFTPPYLSLVEKFAQLQLCEGLLHLWHHIPQMWRYDWKCHIWIDRSHQEQTSGIVSNVLVGAHFNHMTYTSVSWTIYVRSVFQSYLNINWIIYEKNVNTQWTYWTIHIQF